MQIKFQIIKVTEMPNAKRNAKKLNYIAVIQILLQLWKNILTNAKVPRGWTLSPSSLASVCHYHTSCISTLIKCCELHHLYLFFQRQPIFLLTAASAMEWKWICFGLSCRKYPFYSHLCQSCYIAQCRSSKQQEMKIGKAVNNVLEIPSYDQTESENTFCDLDSSTSETKPSESPQIKPCMVQLCSRLDGRALRTMGCFFTFVPPPLLVLPIPK